MYPGPVMADVQVPEVDNRLDDIDVERILSRMERRGPLTFSRKRCLYQAPEFVKRLNPEETVEEGSSVTFECKVIGFPKPTLTWSKDDIIFGDEERASVMVGDNGLYTLCFHDVSKCDEGTYRCRVANREGTTTCSLYLSVKAKSKCRKRKKKQLVARSPLFPPIVEKVVEERKETEAVERQPDSPLTHLYDSISIRAPVTWPEFLGEWAYNMEMARGEEDMDIGSEEVFDNEPCSHAATQLPEQPISSNTFVAESPVAFDYTDSGSAQTGSCVPIPNIDKVDAVKDNSQTSRVFVDTSGSDGEKNSNLQLDEIQKGNSSGICDHLNNNAYLNSKVTRLSPSKEEGGVTESSAISDSCTISKIVVNRSYAKGDSTFSVAVRRTDSPSTRNDNSSRSTMKTMSPKHRLAQLQRGSYSALKYSFNALTSLTWRMSQDMSWLELLFLISGGTLLALWLDLPPSTFVFNIFTAIVIKAVVETLIKEL